MSEREVAKFMVGMSLDAAALQRFHNDPITEFRRYGISEEAQKLIQSKNAPAIHNAIKNNFVSNAASDVINILVVVL